MVSQAWSGDIFQADLNSKYRDLKLLMPDEGAMFWTGPWPGKVLAPYLLSLPAGL